MGKGEQQWATPGARPFAGDLRSDTAALTAGFVSGPPTDPSSDLKQMRRLIDQLEARWLEAAAGFAGSGGVQDDGP